MIKEAPIPTAAAPIPNITEAAPNDKNAAPKLISTAAKLNINGDAAIKAAENTPITAVTIAIAPPKASIAKENPVNTSNGTSCN